jgi:hypothetical protein
MFHSTVIGPPVAQTREGVRCLIRAYFAEPCLHMSQALHLQSLQWLWACSVLQNLEQLSTPPPELWTPALSPNLPEKHFRGHEE